MATSDSEQPSSMAERMRRMEQDIAEIKRALLGDLGNDASGLLGRVRRREEVAATIDLRLTRCEARLDAVEKQQNAWQAQGRLLNYLAGGGGAAGVVALLAQLLRVFGN